MWKILLEEFYGDLMEQKTRAFLTLFAIAWGTIAIVLMLSFGEGLKETLIRGTRGAGQQMVHVFGGETSKTFEGLPKGRRIGLTEDDVELLRRSIPEADMLSPSYGRGVTVKAGSKRTRTHMEAVYPSFEEMRSMYPTSGGRFLNDLDLAEKKRVVFLGDSIAYRLFGAEGAVGKTVWIDDLPFTVVGTMQTKLQFGMNNGPDADRAIIPASTFRTIYGGRYVNSILVRPRSVAEVEVVKKKVYETLGRRYKFDPTDERALGIWDMVEQEKNNYRMTFGIQIFLGVVGAMTLLVAGVGVANIMYVTVRERTREIGTKLAVGARKRHIVAQFLFEALTICLLGGAAGLLVAATVVQLVAHIPPGNMAMEILMHPRLSWPIALGTVSILTLIGFVAGVFPARKAASVDPVESLRYE